MPHNIDRMRLALEALAKETRYARDINGEGPEPHMGSGPPDICVFCPSHIGEDGFEMQDGGHIAHHPWCPTAIARVALGRKPQDASG